MVHPVRLYAHSFLPRTATGEVPAVLNIVRTARVCCVTRVALDMEAGVGHCTCCSVLAAMLLSSNKVNTWQGATLHLCMYIGTRSRRDRHPGLQDTFVCTNGIQARRGLSDSRTTYSSLCLIMFLYWVLGRLSETYLLLYVLYGMYNIPEAACFYRKKHQVKRCAGDATRIERNSQSLLETGMQSQQTL